MTWDQADYEDYWDDWDETGLLRSKLKHAHTMIYELTLEVERLREEKSDAIDLMMKGEALRSNLMLQTILGDFPPKKPAQS